MSHTNTRFQKTIKTRPSKGPSGPQTPQRDKVKGWTRTDYKRAPGA